MPLPRRQTFRALITRGASMAASILMTAVISRLLTHADPSHRTYGVWAFLSLLLTIIATVARLGAENLAVKVAATDPAAARSMVWAALGIVVGTGVLGGAALAAITAARLDGPTAWTTALLFASAVIANNLISLGGGWLRGLGRVSWGAFLELGAAPLITMAVLVGLWLGGRLGLVTTLVTWAGALWLTAIITAGFVAWAFAGVPAAEGVGAGEYLRRHGRSLVSFMVTALGFLLMAQLPVLVLGMRRAEVMAGQLRNALTLANFVALLPTLQISYLTPRFAALHASGDGKELQREIAAATRLAVAAGVLMTLPLLVVPTPLLEVFGSGYSVAAPALRILAVGQLLVVGLGPVYALLTTVGLERQAGRIMIVAVALGLVGLWFATADGLVAVAAAAMIAPLVFACGGAAVARRHGIHPELGRTAG